MTAHLLSFAIFSSALSELGFPTSDLAPCQAQQRKVAWVVRDERDKLVERLLQYYSRGPSPLTRVLTVSWLLSVKLPIC